MSQNSKLNKYINTSQGRIKHRKQCLKAKNILFENDSVQIGCKVSAFYDFYSSHNYVQMQMFVGNKTSKKIQSVNLHYKGTPNMELYVEKKAQMIPENTQYKERVIIGVQKLSEEILLLFDFSSDVLTLKSIPLPITLYSFLSFTPINAHSLPLTSSYGQLSDILTQRYEYVEECQIKANVGIFRKGLVKDLPKFFSSILNSHLSEMYVGQFCVEDLLDQFAIVLLILNEMSLKLTLCSKQYKNFQAVLGNLKYLLAS